jgi:hypothetical protein
MEPHSRHVTTVVTTVAANMTMGCSSSSPAASPVSSASPRQASAHSAGAQAHGPLPRPSCRRRQSGPSDDFQLQGAFGDPAACRQNCRRGSKRRKAGVRGASLAPPQKPLSATGRIKAKSNESGDGGGGASRGKRRRQRKPSHALAHLLGPALCSLHRDVASECRPSCNITFGQALPSSRESRESVASSERDSYAARQSAAVGPPPPLFWPLSAGCDGMGLQWRTMAQRTHAAVRIPTAGALPSPCSPAFPGGTSC